MENRPAFLQGGQDTEQTVSLMLRVTLLLVLVCSGENVAPAFWVALGPFNNDGRIVIVVIDGSIVIVNDRRSSRKRCLSQSLVIG
jgi:hypothetical protein